MLWLAVNSKGGPTPMKKLFTLLFAAALTVSLVMPVFAQDSSQSASSDQSMSSGKKEKKAKTKKAKKAKKAKSDTSTPAPQQ
jgi:predicted lipid-binding transport protein (Tim44 family)